MALCFCMLFFSTEVRKGALESDGTNDIAWVAARKYLGTSVRYVSLSYQNKKAITGKKFRLKVLQALPCEKKNLCFFYAAWWDILFPPIFLVPEPDENSESWQENRIAVSCSCFVLQTSFSIHNVFFQQNKHLLLNKLVCRSKDEQDTAIRFSCHDSEFSSDYSTFAQLSEELIIYIAGNKETVHASK